MNGAGWKVGIVVAAVLVAGRPGVAGAWDGGGGPPGSGSYVLLGGGVHAFTDSTTKDLFDTGWTWDARLGGGLNSYLGVEVAYVGSLNSAKVGNVDLLGNGAEGVVRLQAPYAMNGTRVEPFAFGGIGWRYMSLRNAPAGVKSSDNIGDVPFGGGVTLGFGRLLIDARFTYRWTFNEDFAGSSGTTKLSSWAVNGAIGYTF